MNTPTVAIILDDRRPLKDSSYPVKLRVTYDRKQKYFPTKFTTTKKDWDKIYSTKAREPFKGIRRKYNAIEERAQGIIDKLPFFTFEMFERKYLDTSSTNDAFHQFDLYIEKLKQKGSLRTAISYENALLSFIRFTLNRPTPSQKGQTRQKIRSQKEALIQERTPLPFTIITPAFLQEYENWMLKHKHTLTTVGIYLRCMRTIYNEAIATSDVNPDLYPFSKRKYKIPAGRNNKRPLPIAELQQLLSYIPATPYEARALAYWTFSLFCNGINFKDMARLKYKNIDRDLLTFTRSKTYRTRQNASPIRVQIIPEMEQVIAKYGNKPVAPDTYIFPVLTDSSTPEQELKQIQQAIKTTNHYMKQIAEKLKFTNTNITTYVARHTHAMLQLKEGASAEELKEAFAHENIGTTYQYISSMDDEGIRRYASRLTGFMNRQNKTDI